MLLHRKSYQKTPGEKRNHAKQNITNTGEQTQRAHILHHTRIIRNTYFHRVMRIEIHRYDCIHSPPPGIILRKERHNIMLVLQIIIIQHIPPAAATKLANIFYRRRSLAGTTHGSRRPISEKRTNLKQAHKTCQNIQKTKTIKQNNTPFQ